MNYPQTVEILISFRGFFYFLIFVLDFELRTAAAKTVRQCLGRREKRRQKSIHEDDYDDAFLYSSLNMELVCSILNGIQQNIMVDMFNNHQSSFDECNALKIKDFSSTSTANLTKIQTLSSEVMAKMNKKAFQKMVAKNMNKEVESDAMDSLLNAENFQS